jgi:hypothetical protein
VGAKIDAASTNWAINTPFGPLTCEDVKLQRELTKSSTTETEGVGIGEGTTTTCKHEGVGITFTDLTLRALKASAASTTASLTFVMDIPIIGSCHLEATAAPWVIHPSSSDSIVFTNAALTANPSICGPATLSATFTLVATNSKSGEENVTLN